MNLSGAKFFCVRHILNATLTVFGFICPRFVATYFTLTAVILTLYDSTLSHACILHHLPLQLWFAVCH